MESRAFAAAALSSDRTKKERKAFKNYVWTLERAECQKAMESYLAEAPEQYLRALISLTKTLNQSDLPRAEEEQLLQALALFCMRPKLIFNQKSGRADRTAAEHDVKKFEKEIGRFNRKWASFAAEVQLCEK